MTDDFEASVDSESVDSESTAVQVEVTRGAPTPEELAALVSVVTEAYLSEASETVVDETPEQSTWVRMRRPIRHGLDRDVGWRQYAG